jgi:hypothetical protein
VPLLRVVAVLVGVQGIALIGLGVFSAVELVAATPTSQATGVGVTLLALVAGAGLVWCARGLAHARRWARSPVLVAQLLGLPVAWDLAGSERRALGIVLIVWLAGVAVLLLSRQVTEGLESGS